MKLIIFIKLSFSDWKDKMLMISGLIAAFCGASVYPVIFLLNGRISKTLVNYEKNKSNYSSTIMYQSSTVLIFNKSALNFTIGVSNSTDAKCGITTNEHLDFDDRIKETVNYFVLLGFLTLILQYIAHVTWNISSERQAEKMR